jgi:hypothetical protein
MKHLIHHGYVITVTAISEKGVWGAQANITWGEGKFDLDDEGRFPSQMEAENHAVESGKHWVNNHLQSMQGEN